jgi:hypothetical protein
MSIVSLTVLGSDLETNGCVLHVDPYGVGVELTLRTATGDRLANGLTAWANLIGLALPDPMTVYCGDMQIGPSSAGSALEIRAHSGQLLGYVVRNQVVGLVRTLWRP